MLHIITTLKCPGVCQAEANASAVAHFFGDDKHFLIKIRNEPDPMRDGGSAIKGNAAAMRLTEIEKSMRSEQEGENPFPSLMPCWANTWKEKFTC